MLLDGAVIVSTPQDVALLDATRAVNMFSKVDCKILGMVQNMAFFSCPKCSTETFIFGVDGALKKANEMGIDNIANIPLDGAICSTSDSGQPISISKPDSIHARIYADLAKNVYEKILNQKNLNI